MVVNCVIVGYATIGYAIVSCMVCGYITIGSGT